MIVLTPPPAIIAFLLLFATFAVGLRCFADFDKGLRQSKTTGKQEFFSRTERYSYFLVEAGPTLTRGKTVPGTPMYENGPGLQRQISIE